MALTRVGGDLLKRPLNIGAGVTIGTDGNATFSGIVTATAFVDSAGNPISGGSAGLGTALSDNQDESANKIYYTDTTLKITENTTINPPDSSNIAYTQYSEIAVEEGFDLIVEDGDDLVPDILGIGTDQAPVLPGAGGRVRADQFTNKAGTGAPEFPNGAVVGGDFTVTGSKTYLDSDNVEFKDKNIGISSRTTSLTDNQLHGAGFTIYGLNGDKTLTWDNPNSRMSFSNDLYAPNITSGGSVTAELIVNGDARVTGILTIGTSSITLDGSENQVNVGTGVTLHHTNGVQVGGNTVHSTGIVVNNINASGIITATSFQGDGSALTGIDATSLKDSGGNIKVQANGSGAVVTGVLTATTFSGSGSGLTGITESSISNNAITTAKIADGSITSAKIVDNSTNFDLNRKKVYLPRGFYVYGSDDPVPSGASLNGFPYGEGHTGWSGYTTISGYVANGSTVTARNINNTPNGLLIIDLSRADAGGGPYGNWVGGHEIWSVNTAHHGFSGGGATLIQSTGTLHGSYTTSGWYGIYITGSTGGTYYRVTFID